MATIINNRRDGYAGDPAGDSAVGMFLGIILAVIMLLLLVRFLFPSMWFFNNAPAAATQQPGTINVTLPSTPGSGTSGSQPAGGAQAAPSGSAQTQTTHY